MKLPILVTLAAVVVVTTAIAADDYAGVIIKICGDDLSTALNEACSKKTVNYLLEHGSINDKPVHKHHDHHNRDGYTRGHDGHNHGHDHHDSHSQSEQNDDESILEKCCHKPCLVKEFVAFCGDD